MSFDEGKTIFYDPFIITFRDEFHSEKEERHISIGSSANEKLCLWCIWKEKRHPKACSSELSVVAKRLLLKEVYMKKSNSNSKHPDDDMLPEYNFKGQKGVRGKYYLGPKQAHSVRVRHADGTITRQSFDSLQKVILLDADVAAQFPDSESVNRALRTLISLVPEKQVGEKKAEYRTAKPPRRKVSGRR